MILKNVSQSNVILFLYIIEPNAWSSIEKTQQQIGKKYRKIEINNTREKEIQH